MLCLSSRSKELLSRRSCRRRGMQMSIGNLSVDFGSLSIIHVRGQSKTDFSTLLFGSDEGILGLMIKKTTKITKLASLIPFCTGQEEPHNQVRWKACRLSKSNNLLLNGPQLLARQAEDVAKHGRAAHRAVAPPTPLGSHGDILFEPPFLHRKAASRVWMPQSCGNNLHVTTPNAAHSRRRLSHAPERLPWITMCRH